MPHIDIKCYPKNLSKQQFDEFIDKLQNLAETYLAAQPGDISINYTEIPADQWKQRVWDTEIAPNLSHLAKLPGYTL